MRVNVIFLPLLAVLWTCGCGSSSLGELTFQKPEGWEWEANPSGDHALAIGPEYFGVISTINLVIQENRDGDLNGIIDRAIKFSEITFSPLENQKAEILDRRAITNAAGVVGQRVQFSNPRFSTPLYQQQYFFREGESVVHVLTFTRAMAEEEDFTGLDAAVERAILAGPPAVR